ncbi:hypothetical protein [Massilia sp. Leaf139]|uniref:hypothetical protein n=1 Tax=Massilia sp. Leaf139 TaxID=1736272 RepID=UPI0006F7BCB0|nr:hypothetical protein [Massilia sp. Leaf139]KQQ86840.1 hypothetical protein ASF77_19295 [Massilia sp. Leaf139]
MRTVRTLHRRCAIVVTLFVLLHVVNHAAAIGGIGAHLRFMEAARAVYRQPLLEALLLLCVMGQAGSGLWLLHAGWRGRPGWLAWLQALSGAYLALFLLIHVTAVLAGRAVLDLDTNVHFAAAGLQVWPYQLFFVPYYFLALAAVFAHLGCALARRAAPPGRALIVALPLGMGVLLASLVLAALMGGLAPYEVPQAYKETYAAR